MKNSALANWRTGTPSIGAWSNLPDIHIAELLSRSGIDWMCFDLQHGLMDYSDLTSLLPAVCASPVTPLVRVAANRSDQIGKALDVGAEGVIVPMVNTVEEARSAVAACYYPPLGQRSCGPMRPAMLEGVEYLATANEQIACLLMIETEEGLRNVEEIAAVPGVTGLFVGPVDLCYGLGLSPMDFAHARFTEAVGRILSACVEHGIVAGMFGYTPEMAKNYLANGFNFASAGTDISFVREGVTRALAGARGSEDEASGGERAGY
jgi:4-hydroxy-2-oxoheptanedioate aldolase